MSNKNIDYNLIIKPIFISKSKRFYGIRPWDIIVSEPCELQLMIVNPGPGTFPGGKINNFSLKYPNNAAEKFNQAIKIPPLPPKKPFLSERERFVPINSGTAWIELNVESSDKKQINCYQVSVANNQNILFGTNKLQDYFHVSSKHEIHQRYTNYILLFLTLITVLLFVINVYKLFNGG